MFSALALLSATQSAAPANLTADFKKWPIVYVASEAEKFNIYVANGDGTSKKLIVKDGLAPVWSPDKKRIAFVRGREVRVVDREGKGEWRVFRTAEEEHEIKDVTWGAFPGDSKDTALCLTVETGTETDILFIRMSGSGRGLRDAKPFEHGRRFFRFSDRAYGAVSSTARSLAYTNNGDLWMSYLDDNEWETVRMAPVARYDLAQRRSSLGMIIAGRIDWLPGARKFVYEYQRFNGSGTEQVFLYDFSAVRDPLQGTEAAKRTLLSERAIDPSVSPDGKWVLVSAVYENAGLVAISMDGKRRRMLIPGGTDGDW